MANKMMVSLAAVLLAPTVAQAASFEYYRGVFCDAQTPDFLIESYDSPLSLSEDKLCHQTPAGTMGMKLKDGLDTRCVVLAYEDYGCSNLVGSLPSSGKCVASTTARIGSWQARCNTTEESTAAPVPMTIGTGELKRRGKARLPAIRDEPNGTNITAPCTSTSDNLATASSIASQISSAISAEASAMGNAIASTPSAGAALSSAIASGADSSSSLTSYVTDSSMVPSATAAAAGNMSYAAPTITTSPAATVTFSGNTAGNGTAVMYKGAASSNTALAGSTLVALLGGFLAAFLLL